MEIKKALFIKDANICVIYIVLGLVEQALIVLSHLIPKPFYKVKSTIKLRCIWFQRSHSL